MQEKHTIHQSNSFFNYYNKTRKSLLKYEINYDLYKIGRKFHNLKISYLDF